VFSSFHAAGTVHAEVEAEAEGEGLWMTE
jgi:hypothetical protein